MVMARRQSGELWIVNKNSCCAHLKSVRSDSCVFGSLMCLVR